MIKYPGLPVHRQPGPSLRVCGGTMDDEEKFYQPHLEGPYGDPLSIRTGVKKPAVKSPGWPDHGMDDFAD
jgi:hypothetical protein